MSAKLLDINKTTILINDNYSFITFDHTGKVKWFI